MSRFIDEATIEVRSGDGGNGMVAWRREKYEPMGGPAGGSGGRGGDVILKATNDRNTLLDFHYNRKFQAEHGQKGGSKNKHGKNGQDLIIPVPTGTTVTDLETGATVADLVRPDQTIMVAQGGKGGRGNSLLATPTRRAPHHCEPGQPGVTRQLKLVIKVLADVGLVGLPNAGKSTLLSVLTAARPKIADYPFTTIEPNLGVVALDYGKDLVLADIPGLIEGASEGVGLGHRFLKHLERTRVLVHLVDISSETILQDIATIEKEIALYGERLKSLPVLLALNKTDIVDPDEAERIKKRVEEARPDMEVFLLSAATVKGTQTLTGRMAELVDQAKEAAREEETPLELTPDDLAFARPDGSFDIVRSRKIFFVTGDRPERLVSVTNLRDPESIHHLYTSLKAMGIIDALLSEGIETGNEINIGGVSFTYGDDWL
ncbi:MAG: GTPase ObgE [Candidatus Melainabacteria bacterium]|nr:GTPase ObgE [Candidatus Melainabacteria bacterium]